MNDQIKQMAIDLFVKKEVDLTAPHIIAAIISAARGMSLCSETVSPDDVVDTLLEAFEVKGNPEVETLVGMNSSFVKQNIGFSPVFEDASVAIMNYTVQAGSYEALYGAIKDKVLAGEEVAR